MLLTGFVDRADQVSQIIQIAQEYYPKVIPNIRVGGVQQILLHCKVAEVSRTKARNLGFDFANINGNSFIASSVSGLLAAGSVIGGPVAPAGAGDTVRFGVVNGNSAFFGFLEALRREDMLKILSDPTLVTVSGRPAFFNSGGEFPILVPQSLGTVSIEYKKFGTQIDFVPIVLGNGNHSLGSASADQRNRSHAKHHHQRHHRAGLARSRSRHRRGNETRPNAGNCRLGANATRSIKHVEFPGWAKCRMLGLPSVALLTEEEEIELLIIVTPELVAPLDCGEVPQCFPGMHTDVPNDCQIVLEGLYRSAQSNGPCGPGGCCAGRRRRTRHVWPARYDGSPDVPGSYEDIPPGTTAPDAGAERL